MRRCFALGSLLLVAGVASATAQTYRQFNLWCFGDGTADQTIQGCDAVIRWARETPRDTGTAFYNRGLAWRLKGDAARALQDFDETLRRNPDDIDALYNRALAFGDLKQYDRALAKFGALLQRRPGDPGILEARAVVLLHLARFDAAIADYDVVLKASPNTASALFGRGFARRAVGDPARGNADIAAAYSIQAGVSELFGRHGLSGF